MPDQKGSSANLHERGAATGEELDDVEGGPRFRFGIGERRGGPVAARIGVRKAGAKELWVAVIAGQPPVGPDAGMPMEIDKPRRDEAGGGDKRAIHRRHVGLADER